ncbi:MAG: hypothetical protein V4568_10400 [Pseudomonadota bacterium]
MEHNWNELRAPINKYWSKINEDDVQRINGQEETLTQLIQERYKCSKHRAQRDINRFFEKNWNADI